VICVSKEDHCLADILHRWRNGDLDCDIVGVVSNHDDSRRLVEWHGVDFHHVPTSRDERDAAFEPVARLFEESRADVIVLARYMQILPASLCDAYPGRIINIHHSFLPSFVGARPYRQAFERGVKLIGATCHYVTAELDKGPIIEQDAIRVDHGDSVADLMRIGRDIERIVLARGLRWHLEDRVLLNGDRTVVFA
jgi:formyltetrahydrofolate deformylase